MTYVITQACVDVMDRTCVTQCPVDCIEPGERMLYINPDECIECGACLDVCPQGAIFWDVTIPPEQQYFLQINAAFYTGGRIDPPEVQALPTA